KKDKGKKRKVESKLETEKAIPLYKDVEDELHMLLYQMPFGGIVIRENQTDGADPEEEIKRTPWFPINAPICPTFRRIAVLQSSHRRRCYRHHSSLFGDNGRSPHSHGLSVVNNSNPPRLRRIISAIPALMSSMVFRDNGVQSVNEQDATSPNLRSWEETLNSSITKKHRLESSGTVPKGNKHRPRKSAQERRSTAVDIGTIPIADATTATTTISDPSVSPPTEPSPEFSLNTADTANTVVATEGVTVVEDEAIAAAMSKNQTFVHIHVSAGGADDGLVKTCPSVGPSPINVTPGAEIANADSIILDTILTDTDNVSGPNFE
ncbi:hypothetical protein BGX29_011788, partial [Mortierella sp. GBA35]